MTTLSVIELCPTTKQEAELFANNLINEVATGATNPLDLHIKMNALQKALDKVKEAIRDDVYTEASKHGSKSFEYRGVRVELAEMGVKYIFDGCGDAVWQNLSNTLEMAKNDLNKREQMLKTITGTLHVADESTGEMMEIHPPVKKSTSGIKITML